MQELNKEDFDEWLHMPQTQALFQAVKQEQSDMLQLLVRTVDIDSLRQARVVGIMSGLQKVLDFTYDDGKPQ